MCLGPSPRRCGTVFCCNLGAAYSPELLLETRYFRSLALRLPVDAIRKPGEELPLASRRIFSTLHDAGSVSLGEVTLPMLASLTLCNQACIGGEGRYLPRYGIEDSR
jgi:hypothetical protein